MTVSFRILAILLFSTHLTSFGQTVQSAAFEYDHWVLPNGFEYKEVYSISKSKIEHYFSSDRKGKNRKKRLKKSSHFAEGVTFLDSLLSAEYYTIQLDSIQIRKLLEDTTKQKNWEITPEDISSCFDTQNRICFERKFFNLDFDLPSEIQKEKSDGSEIVRLKWYKFEPMSIDGTTFNLKFSIDSNLKMVFSCNLFQDTQRGKYAEWLSMYLMQEKFKLFEKGSPIAYYFRKQSVMPMIIRYVVWKKYGILKK